MFDDPKFQTPETAAMFPGAATSPGLKPKPRSKKWIYVIIIILVLVVLVAIGLTVVKVFFSDKVIETPITNTNDLLETTTASVDNKPLATPPIVDKTKIDTDGDSLTDTEEITLGTDLTKADSDADGLTDYQEVTIYKTDPLNKDTDGDGYLDGEEVKNGYNPNGPGKLLNLK